MSAENKKTGRGGADRGQGRKSLTGAAGRSPILQVSMPTALREKVAAHAALAGITDAELARRATAEYIEKLEERMITVTIAHEVPDNAFARVEALLADVTLRHTDFGGASYIVQRGDYTELDNNSPGVSEEDACTLFNWVQAAIRGE